MPRCGGARCSDVADGSRRRARAGMQSRMNARCYSWTRRGRASGAGVLLRLHLVECVCAGHVHAVPSQGTSKRLRGKELSAVDPCQWFSAANRRGRCRVSRQAHEQQSIHPEPWSKLRKQSLARQNAGRKNSPNSIQTGFKAAPSVETVSNYMEGEASVTSAITKSSETSRNSGRNYAKVRNWI